MNWNHRYEDQELSKYCTEDKYHYTACFLPSFTPLVFNNTVVAVCGHYVCNYYGYYVFSGEKFTQFTWCNNKVHCYNDFVDEKYCAEKEEGEEVFQCRNTYGGVDSEISMSRVCNIKGDCGYGDDEWNCDGYSYHYWYNCSNSSKRIPSFWICNDDKDCVHGDDDSNCGNVTICVQERYNYRTYTYILANYSRCTAWVWCANKMDHTNCSDTTKAPLQCPVSGYISTVSQYIICRSIIYTLYNAYHTNTSAVCDDGMDVRCVTPVPGCYIHKHQLCDDITDCNDGSDEKSVLCSRVTAESCRRKYQYNKLSKLPIGWIADGDEDCIGGIDEDITNWDSCNYSTFTIYGSKQCEDVYICPSGHPPYIVIPSLCDEMLSCEGGNGICETAALALPQVRYTPVKLENLNYLHYCLLGLENLRIYFVGCEQVNYPTVDILGTEPNHLFLPVNHVNCEYLYGEQYVYLSCSGKCEKAKCPLTTTPLSGSTCSNMLKRRTYSISSRGNLVIVGKHSNGFEVKNIFVCGNENCVPYSKVCNMIDECGDGTDEDSCDNHFVCNVKSNFSKSYIPLSSVCDGQYDCLDSSDEKYCCYRKLINGFTLKMSAWLIGTLALLLNGIIQIRNLYTMGFATTSFALIDKVLITLISFGDWLVGCYLFALAVTDTYYGNSFCSQQIQWLLSSYCSILGVVSTFGSQISLFSMTILSVTRVIGISKGLSIPGPVSKKSYILVSSIIFFIAGVSITVAVIPLIPHFEDTFVNALYLPNINFLRGFVTKKSLKPTLESYYGRIMLVVSDLSWNSVRSLINSMFTNIHGGISHRILGFYGNDPVCLFKFFVSPDEPQSAYSWSLLTTNFVCFGVISISYLIVFVITSASSLSRSQGVTGNQVRSRNNRLQRKISIIILTDFLCWVPFVITCFLHTIGQIDASPWYALLSIVILPINSVINPLLYDYTVGRIAGRAFRRIRREVETIELSQTLRTRIRTDVTGEPEHTPHSSNIILDVARKPGYTLPFDLPYVAREPGHTPPILSDVAREPGHTPPVLSDIHREPGHSPLVLPDVAREPGYTPSVLPDVARQPGNTTPVLPDVAREPGHIPPVLPDVARKPGNTPPVLSDIHREPEHSPLVLPDVAREPGHTPPVLLDVARQPGHTTPVLPDVAREPGHTKFTITLHDVARQPGHTTPVLPDVSREPGHIPPLELPDTARESGHTTTVLPDAAREPGHTTFTITLHDVAREPGHATFTITLHDVAGQPGHTTPVLPDVAREPGHIPSLELPGAARESGHTTTVLPDAAREPEHTTFTITLHDVAREPGHATFTITLHDVAREPGHATPVLSDIHREPGHSPPVLPDVARQPGHTTPVLPDVAREPGHIPPLELPDAARESGHIPPVLSDIHREPEHSPLVLPDVAREPGHTPPVLPDVARQPGHTTPILPDVAREPGHIPPLELPDAAREPGHTTFTITLHHVARQPGHTTLALPDVAREPGHIPPLELPDAARESGHTPPVLSDIHREPGHSPFVLPDVAREPGYTPPVLPDVARQPGHTTPALPDVAREPGHIPPLELPDTARESGHTTTVLPDAAREPGHTTFTITLHDVAREPGHATFTITLHDVARQPGHTTPVLPDVAREPGHIPPLELPGAARESGHTITVLPDAAREPGHTTFTITLHDVAREPGHATPVLSDIHREPGHSPPVLPDVTRQPGHTTPVLPDVTREPGHIPSLELPDAARESGHTTTVLPDAARESGHTTFTITLHDVAREPGHATPVLSDIHREPVHSPPVLPNVAREPGHTPPVLSNVAREPGHTTPTLSNVVREPGHTN